MARDAQPREDLLRDARALSPRILLRLEMNGVFVEVLAGFRGGSLSLYFGDDPALHFNSSGELRRAFVDGRLIKAERGELVALKRRALAHETVLESTTLLAAEHRAMLANIDLRLRQLGDILAANRFVVAGRQPEGTDALPRLGAWLAQHGATHAAESPRVD